MDYIKIVLVIYLILRFINIFPSHNLSLDNDLQNTSIIVILFILAIIDPVVCFITIAIMLVNLKTNQVELLFTPIDDTELEHLANTIIHNEVKEQKNKQYATPLTQINSSKQTQINNTVDEESNSCIKEFIISKSMLEKAQNNIVKTINMQQYPNILKDNRVNIQGVYEDISGFNL